MSGNGKRRKKGKDKDRVVVQVTLWPHLVEKINALKLDKNFKHVLINMAIEEFFRNNPVLNHDAFVKEVIEHRCLNPYRNE